MEYTILFEINRLEIIPKLWIWMNERIKNFCKAYSAFGQHSAASSGRTEYSRSEQSRPSQAAQLSFTIGANSEHSRSLICGAAAGSKTYRCYLLSRQYKWEWQCSVNQIISIDDNGLLLLVLSGRGRGRGRGRDHGHPISLYHLTS